MSDEIVRVNRPEGGFRIEQVSETHTTWIVDAEEEEEPTARQFRDLGTAGTKMVVLSSFLPEPYASEADRIYGDIARLQRMMARERLDDERDVTDLALGNLDVLPEVQAEREQVSCGTDGDDDE